MTRRGRGTDGTPGGGFWQGAEESEEDRRPGRRGRRRSPEPSGPPWETGSWQADPGWRQADDEEPDWQAHPSGPLPPLPAPGAGWQDRSSGWEDEAGGSYQPGVRHPSDEYPSGGYPAGGFGGGDRGRPGSGGYPTGEYASGGYPAGDYGDGGYHGHDEGSGGYPAGDYGSGGYPAAGYPGHGFGDPLDEHGYAGDRYAPGTDTEYDDNTGHFPDTGGPAGYSGRDSGNYPGDPDRGGWYSDVDEQQVWTEDSEPDSGFLPGLASGSDRRPPRGGRPAGRAPKRKRGGARRIVPRLFLAALLLVVLGAGGYGYKLYRAYIDPPDFSGPGTGSVVVQIQSGQTAAAIGQVLQQKGVVASARAFSNAAKASSQGNALEPGYFRLHRHMKASLAFALLLKPSSRVTYKVTLQEGLRVSQIIAKLGKATGDTAGYEAAIKKPGALGLPSYAKGNPEGYLFPATYTIQPGTPPVQVLRSMVQRYYQEAASVHLARLTRQHQISEHDLMVVASLIQAEGGRLQDYPKIARVIYNRLYVDHMQLELDSTVMYALHSYGIMASSNQLNVNSPYNTYRHYGLPPTPIDSPGDAAIQAALHPAQGSWVYFVTVDPKTGLTKFTSDPNVFAQLRAELQQNIAKGK